MKKDKYADMPLPKTYRELMLVLRRAGAMGTPATTGSWWQYSRWAYLVSRNMRITEPEGIELFVVKVVVALFWDPVAQTGTRSWLDKPFRKKAVTGTYDCNLANEPTHVIVELLSVVARDLMKIPITEAEKAFVDVLIAFTGNRRYGTGPYFGGVGGSLVTIP